MTSREKNPYGRNAFVWKVVPKWPHAIKGNKLCGASFKTSLSTALLATDTAHALADSIMADSEGSSQGDDGGEFNGQWPQ